MKIRCIVRQSFVNEALEPPHERKLHEGDSVVVSDKEGAELVKMKLFEEVKEPRYKGKK